MHPNTLLILGNASAIDGDGWSLIAPFGEHPKSRVVRVNGLQKTQKFIQVVDNAAADALLSKGDSLFGKLPRASVGPPVYDGHPDIKDFAPETIGATGAKRQIGVVDQVRAAASGIEAHFVLSPDGATAVANGRKYPSPLWIVTPSGTRGDATICRPTKLLSLGLTANPNIVGVQSLANAGDIGDAAFDPDDKSTWSITQVRAKYQDLLNEAVRRNGGNFTSATATVRALNPDLMDRMRALQSDANQERDLSGSLPPSAPVAVPSPENCAAFGMQKANFDEFKVAFKANGSHAEPVDAIKVFGAMVDFCRTSIDVSLAAAQSSVSLRFPGLRALRDSQVAAAQFGEGRPSPGAGFQATSASQAAPALFAKSMGGLTNPFRVK